MGFWATWNRYNAATKRRISTVKCILEDIIIIKLTVDMFFLLFL